VPKQGPPWQRWVSRHPVQYKLPAGVKTDLPALVETADAQWPDHAASRPASEMERATADDIPPVVVSNWASCSPPYLGERDPHYHHHDARTERHLRDASGILVTVAQVWSTQIHVLAQRDNTVPTPTWWFVLEKPHGIPARMPCVVAWFSVALCRGESTPAAAILALQWVFDVADVVPRPTWGRPLSGRGPAETGAPPKYLQTGPRAGTQRTRCGPGRLDLRWGWAFPKWFSEPLYISCIFSELEGFACFGCMWATTMHVAGWVSERVFIGRGGGSVFLRVIEWTVVCMTIPRWALP